MFLTKLNDAVRIIRKGCELRKIRKREKLSAFFLNYYKYYALFLTGWLKHEYNIHTIAERTSAYQCQIAVFMDYFLFTLCQVFRT